MTSEEKAQIQARAERKREDLVERIAEYRELTKPIPPNDAIGRVSRMDAINNRSVNEAALRQLEKGARPTGQGHDADAGREVRQMHGVRRRHSSRPIDADARRDEVRAVRLSGCTFVP